MLFPQIVDYHKHTHNGSGSGVVWQLTSDRYELTDHFILTITKIATCCEDAKCCMPKISALDFPLLFVFITFTIIHRNKNLIFSEVVFDIIV